MNRLIKVLILGERWGHHDQVFASLSNRRVAGFFGPDAQKISEAISQTNPSAIIISPVSESVFQALLDASPNEQSFMPPVLLCVDHEALRPRACTSTRMTSCWYSVPPPRSRSGSPAWFGTGKLDHQIVFFVWAG